MKMVFMRCESIVAMNGYEFGDDTIEMMCSEKGLMFEEIDKLPLFLLLLKNNFEPGETCGGGSMI